MVRAAEYLLVLYAAERRHSPPIPSGYVADALDRSPSTTTETFQRLASQGLVSRVPYEGVTLTDEGRNEARELYEQYVTLSRFFRDVLDLENHEREAMELAGTVSTTVVGRLATTLLPEEEAEERTDTPVDAVLEPARPESP